MNRARRPELKKYMDKKVLLIVNIFSSPVCIQFRRSKTRGLPIRCRVQKNFFEIVRLNGGRNVQGILRGYDPFMNLVLDQVVEEGTKGEKHALGMIVVRGNSIVLIEALERIPVPRMESY